jgi:hypothetical protein
MHRVDVSYDGSKAIKILLPNVYINGKLNTILGKKC